MPNKIHPTAIIEDQVTLGDNNIIGPYCYLSGKVKLGDNNKLNSHVVISGNTKIGNGNQFFSFANIGDTPQDLKFTDEASYVEIADNNVFREQVTVHSGTEQGNPYFEKKSLTKIGSGSLFMVGSHIAHDCFIADKVILANNATLAGHVTIEENVIIGGLSAVQQFVRVGAHAIVGGMSGVENDVLPYSLIMGERAALAGLNLVGLKRRDFSKEQISNIKNAFAEIFAEEENTVFAERITALAAKYQGNPEIEKLVEFINNATQKAICKPKTK